MPSRLREHDRQVDGTQRRQVTEQDGAGTPRRNCRETPGDRRLKPTSCGFPNDAYVKRSAQYLGDPNIGRDHDEFGNPVSRGCGEHRRDPERSHGVGVDA